MSRIITPIAVALGWLLSKLYDLLWNVFGGIGLTYGVTLIVFTILVRLCIYPLYAKQVRSTANMASIQPKIQELQKKYADDKETLNIKMMELYKEEGFNPSGGCLPMLIQMPIIFGLFALLRNPMTYIDAISSIDSTRMLMAIHESFLWIRDLTQPDAWILPIAAGITTFVSFNQTQGQQAQAQSAAQAGSMMKVMKYFYPIIIVWMGRTFPAGLTIYWFVSQLIQIFLNIHLNKVRQNVRQQNERKKKK